MLVEHFFYFEGADTVSGALDQVVGAAHEPEIAVLVPGGGVASVVNSACEHFLRAFFVAVVTAEHAEGLALVNLDNQFAHFIYAAGLTFGVDDFHAVARRRLADGARLRDIPSEVSGGEGQFRLAVTFLKADARLFKELVVDVQVQSLACGGAVLEAG